MTDRIRIRSDRPGAARARPEFAANLLGEIVPARARGEPASGLPADADLSNVILLALRRRPAPESAQPAIGVTVTAADRPAPVPHVADRWIVACLAGSLAVHAGLAAYYFNRQPPPLASIGVASITAEIVLGADVAAGLAKTPNPSETAASSAPSPDQSRDMAKVDLARDTVKRNEEPQPTERQSLRQPPPSAPDTLLPEPEVAAAVPTEIPTPAPVDVAELPPSPKPQELKSEQPPEPPAPRPTPEPEAAKPVEKPPQTAVAEQPRQKAQRRAKQRGERKTAAVASAASSGIGRGRSDASTNYRGIVAAHLARHKQYPSDARSRGHEGSVAVSFSIDGGGRVTRVALTRGSGVASLDQESLAMVRRASPFPAPPAGQPMSFTVPVSFALR